MWEHIAIKNTASNILAFHTLSKLKDAHMIYDSRVEDCFRLVNKSGRELQFQNCGDGLYTFVNPNHNKIFETRNINNEVNVTDNTMKENESENKNINTSTLLFLDSNTEESIIDR